jgi:hypothetical protein
MYPLETDLEKNAQAFRSVPSTQQRVLFMRYPPKERFWLLHWLTTNRVKGLADSLSDVWRCVLRTEYDALTTSPTQSFVDACRRMALANKERTDVLAWVASLPGVPTGHHMGQYGKVVQDETERLAFYYFLTTPTDPQADTIMRLVHYAWTRNLDIVCAMIKNTDAEVFVRHFAADIVCYMHELALANKSTTMYRVQTEDGHLYRFQAIPHILHTLRSVSVSFASSSPSCTETSTVVVDSKDMLDACLRVRRQVQAIPGNTEGKTYCHEHYTEVICWLGKDLVPTSEYSTWTQSHGSTISKLRRNVKKLHLSSNSSRAVATMTSMQRNRSAMIVARKFGIYHEGLMSLLVFLSTQMTRKIFATVHIEWQQYRGIVAGLARAIRNWHEVFDRDATAHTRDGPSFDADDLIMQYRLQAERPPPPPKKQTAHIPMEDEQEEEFIFF